MLGPVLKVMLQVNFEQCDAEQDSQLPFLDAMFLLSPKKDSFLSLVIVSTFLCPK